MLPESFFILENHSPQQYTQQDQPKIIEISPFSKLFPSRKTDLVFITGPIQAETHLSSNDLHMKRLNH